MKNNFFFIHVIICICCSFSVFSETYYLRDRCVVQPDKPEQVFINPVVPDVASALRKANVLPSVPAIIPPSVFQQYLPEGSPLIGGAVKYIPFGLVSIENMEKVFGLLEDLANSGNGRSVVIEVPNWEDMIKQQSISGKPAPQSSRTDVIRGGDYVKVSMRKGSIAISFQGRAQRSGSIGEIIPVTASATRKQLQCTVLDKGEVSLVQ